MVRRVRMNKRRLGLVSVLLVVTLLLSLLISIVPCSEAVAGTRGAWGAQLTNTSYLPWEVEFLTLEDLDTSITSKFWNGPLQSATIGVVTGADGKAKFVLWPGPDTSVNVIIQFEGEPVFSYRSRVYEELFLTPNTAEVLVSAYQQKIHQSHQAALANIQQMGINFTVTAEYTYVFNGIAVSVKMKDVPRISELYRVKAVYPDYEVQVTLTHSAPLIGAPQVWQMQDALGQQVTGQGIEVAVIDTGIDYTHPDLGAGFGPAYKVIGGYDFVNDDADPMDDMGHGTHVAGIIAANGTVKGIAPDAKLLAYKVLNAYGSGSFSDVISGIERACNPDDDPTTDDAVDVINMSLGGSGDPDDPVSQTVDAAVDLGVAVVVAAGNDYDYQTIGSPGVARNALTVGACDKNDLIADFSSRGPIPGSWAIKPDIIAPGVSVYSTVPETGELGDPSGYRILDGTSMSAPHVAGAAALLKQLHPAWTPEMIKANLMNTAKDVGYDVFTQGAGRVQVYEAANAEATIHPGSLSLGADDITQPSWSVSTSFTITNRSNPTHLDYSFTVSDSLPSGITVTVDPSSVTLAPGETREIVFSLSVDNTEVLNPSDAPYAYEGEIRARSSTETLRVPFAFIKGPMLHLIFTEEPWVVLVHNRVNKSWFYGWPGTSISLLVPEGTYDVMVDYPDVVTWVVREGVGVNTITQVNISKSEAVHQVERVPVDKNGQPIAISSGGESFIHQPSGIGLLTTGGIPLSKAFSNVSTDYRWEWTLSAYQNNDFYSFNGISNGISGPLSFHYSPSDFNHLTYTYHMDPGLNEIYIATWKSYVELDWALASFSSSDEVVPSYPFTQNVYLIPAPTADFHWHYAMDIYEYTGPGFDW